ncbi:MAG: DNA mismatch repair protein MutS2 [Planctomycetota bacterium]|jgi:DNA mismatch repair protein MutS2
MSESSSSFDGDALEFQVVRSLLTTRLITPLGRTAVDALQPCETAEEAIYQLAATTAMALRIGDRNLLPLSGAVEVRSWLDRFFAGEHSFLARDAADLKRVLRTAGRCRMWCSAGEAALSRFAQGVPDLGELVEELERVIDDRGEVLDSASSKLAHLRRNIEQYKRAVDNAMSSVLTNADIRRCLQAPEPSWRNGRPVLQVKVDYRGRVRGVLHDRSTSGATLFVEPDAVVEVANRLSDEQAAENREINVVMADTARGLRRNAAEIAACVEFVARADMLQAKARLVTEDGYVVPKVAQNGPLRLRGARHPLLLQAHAAADIVPLDIALGDPHHLVVVTGPNTGGKTVVLKTVGLLSLMAISGVPIPADEGAEIPFLRSVHADIGDEQAIAQNLSTFSSHVQRIARCVEHSAPDTLVLLDELGAGTDPEEGAVLGYAVLEALVKANVFAVVTTHLGRLKDFAYQHQGAENGSMAFDGKSLEPLYRLDLGIPGNSHALDIASRVGMPKSIVARARELLGKRDQTLDNLIQRVQVARRDAEADRQATADRSRQVTQQHTDLEERMSQAVRKENWLQEEADGVVEAELRRAHASMAKLLTALTQAPGQHGERARELKKIVDGLLKDAALHRRRMAFCHGLKKGDQVFLPRWGRLCKVHKIDKVRELAFVDYGKVRMEVPYEDVSWLQPLDPLK